MLGRRLIGIFVVLAGVLILAVVILARPALSEKDEIIYGVSFSAPHARGLGLDWKETYEAALADLGVRHLRLAAYWNDIEPAQGQFDFTELDYQMDKAAEYDAKVLLAVGRKLPRWPECHEPEWVRDISEKEKEEHILAMVEEVVTRYRDHEALEMWQMENEPLLNFGECPKENRALLRKEEELIRELDANHLILVTDSGELNSWIPAAGYGDMLGTTMYRTVWSKRTDNVFHYDYIFPSWMYRLKARVVGIVRGKNVLISELQGEPWGPKPYTELPQEIRDKSLSPERLSELDQFARRTQLPRAYWWGVEYWSWEKEVQGRDEFWEMVRGFF